VSEQTDPVQARDPFDAHEASLKRLELANAHEYAQHALQLESEGAQRQRDAERSERRDQMVFAAFVLTLVAALILYALHIGKDQVALEALKDVALCTVGGAGGYAIGRKASHDITDNHE
jgi:hypothetical protein